MATNGFAILYRNAAIKKLFQPAHANASLLDSPDIGCAVDKAASQ